MQQLKKYLINFIQIKFNQFECVQVLQTVMAASEVANKIKIEAEVVAERAESLVVSISADQKVAEGKLLAAKPALDAAEAALLVIKIHENLTYTYVFINFARL